jgi:hypothetical protein
MKRPNPKKDKDARRKRNANYWNTGGRSTKTLVVCPDCIRVMKKDRRERQKQAEKADMPVPQTLNASLKCERCKENENHEQLQTKTKPKNADAK